MITDDDASVQVEGEFHWCSGCETFYSGFYELIDAVEFGDLEEIVTDYEGNGFIPLERVESLRQYAAKRCEGGCIANDDSNDIQNLDVLWECGVCEEDFSDKDSADLCCEDTKDDNWREQENEADEATASEEGEQQPTRSRIDITNEQMEEIRRLARVVSGDSTADDLISSD